MFNYNSSNYYRANPYKDIGYLPPGANKNRKDKNFEVEMPQGEEHFEPTTKKHYGYTYVGEIESDHIMSSPGQKSPLQQEARQRSYFRSLNSQDIEGACTNTLISKAVKNKLKAQEELRKRKEREREAAEAQKQKKYQQEQTRRNMMELYHKQALAQRNTVNYHEASRQDPSSYSLSKKQRDADLLRLAQQRKNYALASLDSLRQSDKQTKNYHNSPYNSRDQPREAERSQSNSMAFKLQNSPKNYNNQVLTKYGQNEQNASQKQQAYVHNFGNYEQSRQYPNPSIEQDLSKLKQVKPYDAQSAGRDQYEEEINRLRKESKNQNEYAQYDQRESFPANFSRGQQINERAQTRERPRNSYPETTNEPIEYRQALKLQTEAMSPKLYTKREQLRLQNPTFLSYGSPSFSIASRNVIGGY